MRETELIRYHSAAGRWLLAVTVVEDPPPTVAITERATEQDQSGQGQQIAVDDRLQAGHVGIEIATNLRQGYVCDRRLKERDA